MVISAPRIDMPALPHKVEGIHPNYTSRRGRRGGKGLAGLGIGRAEEQPTKRLVFILFPLQSLIPNPQSLFALPPLDRWGALFYSERVPWSELGSW